MVGSRLRQGEEAERYAEAARRELEKLGIDSAPEVVRRGPSYDVVFDEKTLRRLAEVDEAIKQAIERLEVLSAPRIAAKPIIATRLEAKPERPVKPKIEARHEELPRPVSRKPRRSARRCIGRKPRRQKPWTRSRSNSWMVLR